jgi:shikimate dehydrogenase
MRTIDASFRVCALLGLPARHSMGPAIHNAAFDKLGLPFVYVAHDVLPSDLEKAIAGARALGYRGMSVTMPHKLAAMRCMDRVDPTADAIGCINTVVNDDGVLTGYNSDGQGALDALARANVAIDGRRVLVLGSGGAARAVAMTMALRTRPAKMVILGVVDEELARLCRDIEERTPARPKTGKLDDDTVRIALGDTDVLLHCTPVGMTPETERSLIPPTLLVPELSVFDAVYNPRRSRLLRDAAGAGCRIVEGMEMFLGQAMVQFELWTGKPAPAQVMREVIEARL